MTSCKEKSDANHSSVSEGDRSTLNYEFKLTYNHCLSISISVKLFYLVSLNSDPFLFSYFETRILSVYTAKKTF